MNKDTEKKLKEYLILKKQVKVLEKQVGDIGKELLEDMDKIGEDKLLTDKGSVSLSIRITPIYSKETRERLEKVKSLAEESGEIEFKTSMYLITRLREEGK